jgi:hypothetical protein
MSAKSTAATLSLTDLLAMNDRTVMLLDNGVDTGADRLLLDGAFEEAAQIYQACGLDDLHRREKLAYCRYYTGAKGYGDILDKEIERATPWGLALHFWAWESLSEAEKNSSVPQRILQAATAIESFPGLRQTLIAAIGYHAGVRHTSQGDFSELYQSACTALQEMGSSYIQTLKLCTAIVHHYSERSESSAQLLRELVDATSAESTPTLAPLFTAANIIGDIGKAESALAELCRRFADDPDLEPTISAVAIEEGKPGLLEVLPEHLLAISLNRPEVRLITALAANDLSTVIEIAESMPANGPPDSVLYSPRISEPLIDFAGSGRRALLGGWGGYAPWCFVLGERLVRTLPKGDLRRHFLRSAKDTIDSDDLEEYADELCSLFEEHGEYDDFYSILTPECLRQVDPEAFANYLVKAAEEDSEYSPLYGDEDEDSPVPWHRFIPSLKQALAALTPEKAAFCTSVLESWDIPLRAPLADRLAGEGMPESLSAPLAAIQAAITECGAEVLPYLQVALMKLSARAAALTPPATAEDTVIQAINDFLKPRHLTDYGVDRARKMTGRYGAAGVLQGLEALLANPDFNPETDRPMDALANTLVKLQGTLISRRAYLAGILRKRLKNLKSHWLDQQVSEAMGRGVDIEQMIELAKGVSSWDDWSEGLENLQPY